MFEKKRDQRDDDRNLYSSYFKRSSKENNDIYGVKEVTGK